MKCALGRRRDAPEVERRCDQAISFRPRVRRPRPSCPRLRPSRPSWASRRPGATVTTAPKTKRQKLRNAALRRLLREHLAKDDKLDAHELRQLGFSCGNDRFCRIRREVRAELQSASGDPMSFPRFTLVLEEPRAIPPAAPSTSWPSVASMSSRFLRAVGTALKALYRRGATSNDTCVRPPAPCRICDNHLNWQPLR